MMVISIYQFFLCSPPHGLDFGFCTVFFPPKKEEKEVLGTATFPGRQVQRPLGVLPMGAAT